MFAINKYINKDNKYINKDNKYINKDNKYINKDNKYINNDNKYINKDNKYKIFSNGSVHIFADNTFGRGNIISKKNSCINDRQRYYIVVYFSDKDLVIANVHAPRNINVKKVIGNTLKVPYKEIIT